MLFVIIIVFMIASLVVSYRLKKKFKKYSQIPLANGLTGREIAELMLRDSGISNVKVTHIEGQLTDHYNPVNRTVNLSEGVYFGNSAASAAIAAHECGHAVQHATAYQWLEFRSAMVPIQSVSAKLINILFIMMFFGAIFLGSIIPYELALIIIISCYFILTTFSFITLPVEYDASNRALAWITDRGIVNKAEYAMAKDALNTAANTYLIAALGSLATLLYYVLSYIGLSGD